MRICQFILGGGCTALESPQEVANYVKNIEKNSVLTYAGVLEHLRNMREMMQIISDNKSVRYVFFSVPTMSLSAALGIVFPNVFNRLLNGWHTHLFTEKSLNYLYDACNLQPIARWDFGTDINDLLRSLVVTLKQKKASDGFIDSIDEMMRKNMDDIQLIIDKSGLCAETHVVCKKSDKTR